MSDDNPYSEALFRTAKYRPDFPDPCFASLEHVGGGSVRCYSAEHLYSGVRFVTPTDRHTGRDVELLAAREGVYAAAKARHPERWGTHPTRDWSAPQRVCVRARKTGEEVDEKVV